MCWEDRQLVLIANMIDLLAATGHIHYSRSAALNIKTIALTYQNNTHGYISNFLQNFVIHYVLAVVIGPVYGLILSQSRSLCDALMRTMHQYMMHQCAEIHKAMLELTRNANKTSELMMIDWAADGFFTWLNETPSAARFSTYSEKIKTMTKVETKIILRLRLRLWHR